MESTLGAPAQSSRVTWEAQRVHLQAGHGGDHGGLVAGRLVLQAGQQPQRRTTVATRKRQLRPHQNRCQAQGTGCRAFQLGGGLCHLQIAAQSQGVTHLSSTPHGQLTQQTSIASSSAAPDD
jgi:hypothetical protein